MAKKITALPSIVVSEDGKERYLDDLSPTEREEWQKKVWKHIENVINSAIAENPSLIEKIIKTPHS